MIANYHMIIDFARPSKTNTIVVAENDAETRNCNFKLLFDKQPFDMTGVVSAVVKGVKKDGSIVWDTAEIKTDEEGNYINELSYLLPLAVTENAGNVTMTITLEGDNSATITSFEFYIKARNTLYNEDDVIDADDMEGFRDLLVRSQQALARMEEMVERESLPNPYPFRYTIDGFSEEYTGISTKEIELDDVAYLGDAVGAVEVTEDDSAAQIAVEAAESAQESLEGTQENLSEITNIVNEFESKIPTATVSKTGHTATVTITDQHGISSAEIYDGDIGPTPNITASATVDDQIGTPAVTVVKTGTDEAPAFAFNFANLKGEKGDPGSGSTVEWGEIYGTLSEQTDLVAALDNVRSDEEGLIKDTVGWTGKNLIALPPVGTVHESNGITFTVRSDGGVSVVGTSTAGAMFTLTTDKLYAGEYTASCVFNGTNDGAYPLFSQALYAQDGTMKQADYMTITNLAPAEKTKSVEGTDYISNIVLYVRENRTVDQILYPMIRKASVKDSNFEPYHGTVDEVKADKSSLATVATSGDYDDLINTPTSETAVSGGTDLSLVTTGEKYTWNGKQDQLTFDSTPTNSSTNPVTSNGVFHAIKNVDDKHIEWLQKTVSTNATSVEFMHEYFDTISYDQPAVIMMADDGTGVPVKYTSTSINASSQTFTINFPALPRATTFCIGIVRGDLIDTPI